MNMALLAAFYNNTMAPLSIFMAIVSLFGNTVLIPVETWLFYTSEGSFLKRWDKVDLWA